MKQEIKPISLEEINKIELVEDGSQFQRFDDLVRQVVNVPRAEILRREEMEKKKRDSRKKY